MSQRKSIYVFHQVPTERKTVTPNNQISIVSGEIRIFYPYTATREEILAVIEALHVDALEKLEESHAN